MKNCITVMDFGSSKITVLSGVKEVNTSFKLISFADCDYEGFANGEFVDANNLKTQIMSAINTIEKDMQCKISSLFVGVPAEFCFVYEKMLTKTFAKSTRITPKIVDSLYLEDTEENPYKTHTVINKSPMYYVINDDNKTNDPINQYATKLQAKTSYILVENKFKMLVSSVLEECGIRNYDFLSSTLAEANYLIDENKRNEGAILVDCGFVTTSVCQILGDGLLDLKSFSMGGGFITADLSRVLEITYDEAEELKKSAVITLKPLGVDFYLLDNGKRFGIKNVNEIILARLDKICELIHKCLDEFENKLPDYIPICFTGGGLNYLDGVTDYLRKEFNRPILRISPKALLYKSPDLSSSISLLSMALDL